MEFSELRIADVAGLLDDLSVVAVGLVVLVRLQRRVECREVDVGDVAVTEECGGQDRDVTLWDQTGGQHHVAPLVVFDALVVFVAVEPIQRWDRMGAVLGAVQGVHDWDGAVTAGADAVESVAVREENVGW